MQIQKDKKHTTITIPTLIPLSEPIKKILAGSSYSYAIADHNIYSWGTKCHPTTTQPSSPIIEPKSKQKNSQLITIPISVQSISTDTHHTFAWSQNEVYCWGSNESYELGLQEERQYGVEKMEVLTSAIQKGYRIISISCGQHHSLAALQENGYNDGVEETQDSCEVEERSEHYDDSTRIQLFAWGQSQSYQLTLDTTSIVPYPVLSPCLFKHLEQLQSRSDYNIAVCNGKVYSWGCNLFSRLGQLVPSSQLPEVRVPRHVILPERIIKVGIGVYHVVAVSSSGQAFSWGKGNMGQLGIDRFQIESKPSKMVCDELIKDVSCGESHTVVLLRDGRLKSCGSNAHDALGHTTYDLKDKKKRAKRLQFVHGYEITGSIDMLSCGNNHNLALNQKGQVYGWGNNDFYQVMPARESQSCQDLPLKATHERRNIGLKINIDSEDIVENRLARQSSRQTKEKERLQKLLDWKRRYNTFRAKKEQQELQFMKELEQITGSLIEHRFQ